MACKEPKLFVSVLPGLQLHTLKIGTESVPEVSENFRTLTQPSAQEHSVELHIVQLEINVCCIREVEGRFANIKMLYSCFSATVSSSPKKSFSVRIKLRGCSAICSLEWAVVCFGLLLY
jgi:tRNA(Ser,Leu) C12 N-acetylase TAN1